MTIQWGIFYVNSTNYTHSACSAISSTSKTCCDLSNDISGRWASFGTIKLSKIIQPEAILCLSGDGFFTCADNDIHCVQCHRTVSLNDPRKAYLAESHTISCPFYNDICDVKYNTENTQKISFKSKLYNNFVPAYFRTMFAPFTEDPFQGADWNPTLMDICSVVASIYYPPASHLISAIKIASVFYVFVNIPGCKAKAIDNIIEIDDFKTFKKIGQHKDYRLDGHYIITQDLVDNEHSYPVIKYFVGSLDGQGHSISNQSGCLIETLTGHGIIGNILFNNSNSTDASDLPLVAHFVNESALIQNIRVENYVLNTTQADIRVALIAGTLSGMARLEGCSVLKSTINLWGSYASFGFLALKMMEHSSANGNRIIESRINTYAENRAISHRDKASYIGSIIDMHDESRSENITAIKSILNIAGQYSFVSFGSALLVGSSQSNKVIAIECEIKLLNIHSFMGIGAAELKLGTTSNANLAISCHLVGLKGGVYAAIGAGIVTGTYSNGNMALNSHIELKGTDSYAGVGIGGASLKGSSSSISNIVSGTRLEALNKRSSVNVEIGRSVPFYIEHNIIVNSTFVSHKSTHEIAFSGGHNRSTSCHNLRYHRAGFVNDNCTLNQPVVGSYINEITKWNTTMLDIGRVIKIPDPVSVTTTEMIKGNGSTMVTKTEIQTITSSITSPITLTNVALITVIVGSVISLVGWCYCRGYKRGNRGTDLLVYPAGMCQQCIHCAPTSERQNNMNVVYNISSRRGNDEFDDLPPPPYSSRRGSDETLASSYFLQNYCDVNADADADVDADADSDADSIEIPLTTPL